MCSDGDVRLCGAIEQRCIRVLRRGKIPVRFVRHSYQPMKERKTRLALCNFILPSSKMNLSNKRLLNKWTEGCDIRLIASDLRILVFTYKCRHSHIENNGCSDTHFTSLPSVYQEVIMKRSYITVLPRVRGGALTTEWQIFVLLGGIVTELEKFPRKQLWYFMALTRGRSRDQSRLRVPWLNVWFSRSSIEAEKTAAASRLPFAAKVLPSVHCQEDGMWRDRWQVFQGRGL